MKTEFVPRVNQVKKSFNCFIILKIILFVSFQLDALQLDKDILRIVRDQLTKSLQNLSVKRNHSPLRNSSYQFADSFSAWPLESFYTGIGSDFAVSTLELFRTTERIHVWPKVALHQLRSRPIIRQSSSAFAFYFEYFTKIFQRQCHISIHTKSIVATIYRLRRTLHCIHGHCEFLSVLENRKTAFAY